MTTERSGRPKERSGRRGWTDQQSVFWYRMLEVCVGLLFRFWIRRYVAVGAERVPADGGAFLIANHTSGLDPFVVAYPVKHRMLHGPGKVELFANPFWGYIMRKLGIFPIRQYVADAAAVRTMVELFRHGRIIIIYPEGGRSDSGELGSFFPDFARLVIRLKAPLVPAAIVGARDALPIGHYFPRPNTPIVVHYGECFDLSAYYDRELTPELVEEAAALMRERVACLLPEAERERRRLL